MQMKFKTRTAGPQLRRPSFWKVFRVDPRNAPEIGFADPTPQVAPRFAVVNVTVTRKPRSPASVSETTA